MNRRSLLAGAAAILVAPVPEGAWAQTADVAERIARVEDEIAGRRAAGSPIPSKWVAAQLGEGLSPRERRIAAFGLVRNAPYKLTSWKGDPDSLFSLGRGDCRHKSAALVRLFKAWQFAARPVQIPFDWADLPIPADVLAPLLETRGIHDSLEVSIDGRYVLADPTWDPALATAGFPVLDDWDGTGPTLPITRNAEVIVRPGELKAGTDLYAHFGIQWPQRERTLAFNRAFNTWSDKVRARAQVAKG